MKHPLSGFTAAECAAERLRDCWIVRPRGNLGTCGFYPRAWTAVSVKARSSADAIAKALKGAQHA